MKIEPDKIILSTGKEIPSDLGLIALDVEGDVFAYRGVYLYADGINPYDLTNQELIEIANNQIRRWTDFKIQIENKIN